jgi:glycine cleavage system H lipoate-binding protein
MMKTIEYLVGLGFLALFVGFWRLVNGESAERQTRRKAVWSTAPAEWFRVPERVFFHRGHAWAEPEPSGVLTVGLDDFAQQLVGPIKAIRLPEPGSTITAGERAWSIAADSKAVDMLAPVSGTVVAVNPEIERHALLANEDPYGRGWLFKVLPKTDATLDGLLSGAAARRWTEQVTRDLGLLVSPELGHVMQDGGMPIHGLARGIDEEHWERIAARFLLTARD